MTNKSVYQNKLNGENEINVILSFNQPLTANQISQKTDIPQDTVIYLTGKLKKKGLLYCLNPLAVKSRLYWFTEDGEKTQKQLCRKSNISFTEFNLAGINWNLYGKICFNHRSAVIRILTYPLQPSKIKNILRIQKPDIKITVNNIQDIIKWLLSEKIVKAVKLKNYARPRYQLTEQGQVFRSLLLSSKAPVGQNRVKNINNNELLK